MSDPVTPNISSDDALLFSINSPVDPYNNDDPGGSSGKTTLPQFRADHGKEQRQRVLRRTRLVRYDQGPLPALRLTPGAHTIS